MIHSFFALGSNWVWTDTTVSDEWTKCSALEPERSLF